MGKIQRTNNRLLLCCLIFLLIALAVSLLFSKEDQKKRVFEYLPGLKTNKLREVKFQKLYADPSYSIPYNVLISFESNGIDIKHVLGLKDISNIDTLSLKRNSWIEEYNSYFTMESVNAIRYTILQQKINKINWWKISEDCNNILVSPFLDQGNKREIVDFGSHNNGRIVCSKCGSRYLILIECWG